MMENCASRQRGNALFLILIAVALFAALSYAITQSSRGGGSSVQKEKDVLLAAQIIQIGSDIKTAVQRLSLAGLSLDSIKLHATGNPMAPCTDTDGTCVFTPEGGGISWPTIPADAQDANAAAKILAVLEPVDGVSLVGTSLPDGYIYLVGVTRGVCVAINKGLGVSNDVIVPDSHAFDVGTAPVWVAGQENPPEGCIDFSALVPGEYLFYYVYNSR